MQLIAACNQLYLQYMTTAPLDRRVTVQLGTETVELHLSELRDQPYVVLLGEPGIGKSTALEHEATQENGELLTCREAMNGITIAGSSTAYLDALDEYRAGENGKDKLLQLANVISNSGVARWRLTCRAEDWRAAADMLAMRRAANNQSINVAYLLSLNDEEAQNVLTGLGETDPGRFLKEARSRGASCSPYIAVQLDRQTADEGDFLPIGFSGFHRWASLVSDKTHHEFFEFQERFWLKEV